MSIRVRDTLSTEQVEVGADGNIGLYICGPTVYGDIHIGNARAPLFWDSVVRYLRGRGYAVRHVQNITDIDDKIINRANEEGVSWKEIVARYTDSFHATLELLGVALPDIEPRATGHIPEMITLIEELMDGGHAYAPGNGDVYFAVESYPQYGALSKQRAEEMREGGGVEPGVTEHKRSALDFTLWKSSKPGEPSWESPWGAGRPGWHLECSAMVGKHLPGGADIHGGGSDLRFPHHENELAQSCCAHPESTFVRAWAHHGMVIFSEGKMAKSTGNILAVDEVVERHGRNAVRMWILQSHYSQPIEYSDGILAEKRRSYERLLRLYRQISVAESSSELSDELAGDLRRRFDAAMADDLNTPGALAAAFEAAGRAGRELSSRPETVGELRSFADALAAALTALGFDLSGELATEVEGVVVRYVEHPGEETLRRVAERELARKRKDFESADRLRDELAADGWTVQDAPEGPFVGHSGG